MKTPGFRPSQRKESGLFDGLASPEFDHNKLTTYLPRTTD